MNSAPGYRFENKQGGFTLIELLVATMLLSLVMTSVYSLTHASLRTWRGVEGGYDMHMEARNLVTLFGHEYNNIVGRAGHLFEGDDKEITMFIVAQPMDTDQGEGDRLMRVIYSYNSARNTVEREEALVETALPKRPADDSELDRSRIKLQREYDNTIAENVTRFTFTYIWVPLPEEVVPGMPPVQEPPVYMTENRERWGLPQGVKLEIEMQDPDDPEKNYSLTTILPMRAPNARMKRGPLEEMLGADG